MRVFKGLRLVFDGGWSVIDGTIRDLSPTGARLTMESVVAVPSEFTLILNDRDWRRRCQVKWRSPKALGVAFR